MATWNSVIFLKTQKDWTDTDNVSKWPGVKEIWSTSGEWDWCIKLDKDHSSPEQTEKFVAKLRQADWVADTESNWWREVYSK
ncbi:hypothetical protein E3983_02915 [Legionella israelensis]|uniref:Transcription regulator AsnC/Lrp ligand binding domain-containing protein n=1 Tax=Legionella israelensis TaxID=454 RepID=A0A0W0WQG1_9GAMM|nr:hypothetical protein [Legionella israelensis]KTD34558.1 hypothetical protein Lisr_0102 [Legionella israelensis]QBR83409.1 hypothetical protein E3983_02915 [Legionella israelensis]QBS09213.1 hypothetical protein E4T55_04715 [Legionella israelensis]QDP71935.1 hypothetical protein FOG18_04770 [Legionella israelensis]SCX99039.1 hypothetical protein SAMN02746069_00916 [Legionella israelensis DSM 19235]